MAEHTQNVSHGSASGVDRAEVYRKISLRLIPYIFLLYILAYLDRVNVSFAALEMKRDLHLSDTVYGVGAGIFFLGQLLFDLPSNLMLNRVGPRLWIARIMVTWGIVATCMMLVKGEWSFYGLRLLLGISEAGFFPGMILYLTYWFPSHERGRAVARFMTATAIAGVIGAPVSHFLLKLEGTMGLHGWQWLFLLEGAPTALMGLSVLFLLPDHPKGATWLSDDEKQWLEGELEQDRKSSGSGEHSRLRDAFRLPIVWLLAGIWLLNQLGIYTVTLWMPLVLESVTGHSSAGASAEQAALGASKIALWAALPYLAATVAMVFVGASSDRTQERRGHIAVCLLAAASGLGWAAYAHSLPLALSAFILAAAGYWSFMGPFWAMPTRVLEGDAAAAGVAVITMIGSVGGFIGPSLTGLLRDRTHGYTAGLLVIGATAVLGAGLSFLLPGQQRTGNVAKP